MGNWDRRLKPMNAKREIAGILCSSVCLMVVGTCALALGQQAPAEKPNELVAGKLIYVAPMSDGLDRWLIDFLRRWGKYKVTSNPEGVDLVIQAENPEKELRLETRAGTAEPSGSGRPPLPLPKRKHDELPAISISVTAWVTGQPVWQADILKRNQKKNEAAPPAGPQTKIFAHGMTSDQLAQKVIAMLRRYEEGLEKPAGEKH
jgi:hypothetical protein